MAQSNAPPQKLFNVEQLNARADCRTGVEMRISTYLNKPEEDEYGGRRRISKEVRELCGIIAELGQQTGPNTWAITFGHLFETYTRISNKLVGIMTRARRQKLVHFEGDTLFEGRDDDVIITLLKHPNEIEGVGPVRQS